MTTLANRFPNDLWGRIARERARLDARALRFEESTLTPATDTTRCSVCQHMAVTSGVCTVCGCRRGSGL